MDALLTGPATPYPSSVTLSGYTTAVYKVTATLSNLSHTYPDDLDILLVGPGGQNAMLMSDAGINFNLSNVTLTFDDDAPDTVPNSDQIVDGTFHPTNYPPAEIMPLPAPPPPYVSALSVFKGTDPNGTWSLFVFDDTSEDGGSIGDGWSLTVTTMDTISDLAVTQRETPNPSAVGTNLTFTLTVTNFGPAGASAVKLTDPLPAGLNLLSLTNSSGVCGNSNGVATCAWDSLAKGAGAVITFVVQPVLGGQFTNSATVVGQHTFGSTCHADGRRDQLRPEPGHFGRALGHAPGRLQLCFRNVEPGQLREFGRAGDLRLRQPGDRRRRQCRHFRTA
jgi:uncharacterized repeat protein (TIGR01451 family)